MLSIAIALGFITSWMLYYIHLPAELLNTVGPAAFQIGAILIPTILWFVIFQMTVIGEKLPRHKVAHLVLMGGNAISILGLVLHVIESHRSATKTTVDLIMRESPLDKLALWSIAIQPFGRILILVGMVILILRVFHKCPAGRCS